MVARESMIRKAHLSIGKYTVNNRIHITRFLKKINKKTYLNDLDLDLDRLDLDLLLDDLDLDLKQK